MKKVNDYNKCSCGLSLNNSTPGYSKIPSNKVNFVIKRYSEYSSNKILVTESCEAN